MVVCWLQRRRGIEFVPLPPRMRTKNFVDTSHFSTGPKRQSANGDRCSPLAHRKVKPSTDRHNPPPSIHMIRVVFSPLKQLSSSKIYQNSSNMRSFLITSMAELHFTLNPLSPFSSSTCLPKSVEEDPHRCFNINDLSSLNQGESLLQR